LESPLRNDYSPLAEETDDQAVLDDLAATLLPRCYGDATFRGPDEVDPSTISG
jgi:hypothetical protein